MPSRHILGPVNAAAAVLADLVRGEEPIPLVELPHSPLVPRKRGRPVHVSAVFRWASRGLRGHRLETARCGGVLCTTRSAVTRFYASLSCVACGGQVTPLRRHAALAAAESHLAASGL